MLTSRAFPPLSAIRVFEAAARLGSFKKAAEELNLTQSAVSHRIASLEHSLGTRLFDRLPGRVVLGPAGKIYFAVIQDALDRIATVTALIKERQGPAALTVQVYVTVAVRWLIPRLHAFREASPEIVLGLDASLLDWEFNPDKADVGIIYTQFPNRSDTTYTLLKRERLVAVCAPNLAGSIKRVEDLRHTPILSLSTGNDDWKFWAAAVKLDDMVNSKMPSFDSYLLAIEAAADGQGVAVVPEFLVEADVKTGKLVVAVPSDVLQPGGWYLTHLQRRRNEPAIRKFREWLVSN